MKICILSDSHDNREPLEQVTIAAKDKGAECIIHCGDVVASSTLNVVLKHNLPIHVIYGNNKGDLTTMAKMAGNPKNEIHFYGQDADITLGGKRFFIVHYPHYAEGMALTGRYDVVCCGHTHILKIDKVNNINGRQTLLINPGNTAGIGEEPRYVLMDTSDLSYKTYTL